VRAAEKLVGTGAVIMALCCALLPFAGAALGGGLIAGAGTVGVIIGVALLGGIAVLLWRRRRSGDRC
jgi:LPXTG-motif cell wall-anchored protein